MSFEKTRLWQRSLAAQGDDDPDGEARERLRSAFSRFRERAAKVAQDIECTVPNLTVHDVTHLDALWEMADLIVGERLELNPVAAFVLGGAFLVHDLGNGAAAYPNGLENLRRSDLWRDTVATILRERFGRPPTEAELEQPGDDIPQLALELCLRQRHAEQAEKLATEPWSDREGKKYYLIEEDLRDALGYHIGQLAASHWWPIERVRKELNNVSGAPTGFPPAWEYDLLTLACLVRTADASHLDRRRAPAFLRALRKPVGDSDDHWVFQGRLQQPRIEANRIHYTSTRPFGAKEFDAWWLGYDALRMVDGELRQVDALLAAANNRERFEAWGVAGAEHPQTMKRHLKVAGWEPIDTKVHVSDVADLLQRLGGRELYGDDPTIPLRELIQNGADAVRARSMLEGDEGMRRITVRLGESEENGAVRHWIEVVDTGIGMSEQVLARTLLDFGNSFWGTPLMHQEHPGLWSKGFLPVGRYGIGFFSLFMWGRRVEVASKKYDEGRATTRILAFSGGPGSRPLLRTASKYEQLNHGGTRVRVWLEEPIYGSQGLFSVLGAKGPSQPTAEALADLCRWLAPTLDVDLYVEGIPEPVVKASDWLTMTGPALLSRLAAPHEPEALPTNSSFDDVAKNLRPLYNDSGRVVGRACILPSSRQERRGVATIGGLRACTLDGVCGVIEGRSDRVARDIATPLFGPERLAEWASEQAELVPDLFKRELFQFECAAYIRACGGSVANLPIAREGDRFFRFEDLVKHVALADCVWLVDLDRLIDRAAMIAGKFPEPLPNVLAVNLRPRMSIARIPNLGGADSWCAAGAGGGPQAHLAPTLGGAVIEALAARWGVDVAEIYANSSFSQDDDPIMKAACKIGGHVVVESVHEIKRPNRSQPIGRREN